MRIGGFFKRRKFGPLTASPFGLAIFALSVAAIWAMADGVYRDMAIRDQLLKAVFAAPLCHAL